MGLSGDLGLRLRIVPARSPDPGIVARRRRPQSAPALDDSLGMVAYGMQVARGLPRLHDDGRRTELGEAWRASLPPYMAAVMAERTEWLPPMTPAVPA